jgi:hypothetical protein
MPRGIERRVSAATTSTVICGARPRKLAAVLGYRSASSVGKACRRAEAAARTAKARRELEELVAHVAATR